MVLFMGSVLVAAIVVEVSLRILGIGYGSVHMASSAVLHHVHPRDYRFVSYHQSREYGGHVVYYDEAGRRADPIGTVADQPRHEVSVAVMGDSFVEALQVA